MGCPASAASRHSRYVFPCSTTFASNAPMESSLSGVGAGQAATTSGLGWPSGDGLVGKLHPRSRNPALSVDSIFTDLALGLLNDGRIDRLEFGDGISGSLLGGFPGFLAD